MRDEAIAKRPISAAAEAPNAAHRCHRGREGGGGGVVSPRSSSGSSTSSSMYEMSVTRKPYCRTRTSRPAGVGRQVQELAPDLQRTAAVRRSLAASRARRGGPNRCRFGAGSAPAASATASGPPPPAVVRRRTAAPGSSSAAAVRAERSSAATRSARRPRPIERLAHEPADDGVRLAERHAPRDEELGEVGGGRASGRRPPPPCARCRSVDGASSPAMAARARRDLVDRVEQRLLVLLQVAVVRERQALERGEEPGEVADRAGRPCPGPARRCRGSSSAAASSCRSRTRRRGGGSRTPRSTTARSPRRAARGARRASARSNSASATKSRSRHRVERVLERARRSRGRRRCRRGRAAATSRPARRRRAARRRARATGVEQTVDVARQRPAVGEQVVREQHRLRPLQVGVARAGRRRRPRRPASSSTCWSVDARGRRRAELALARRAAGRWRPGRCGCGRCGAWRRRGRRAR